MYSACECTFIILTFKTKLEKICKYLEPGKNHNVKKLSRCCVHTSRKEIKLKLRNMGDEKEEVGMVWDKQIKAGETFMVRCSTLKEAELIPDSAVPYTLPESR